MSFKLDVLKFSMLLNIGGTEVKAEGDIGDLTKLTSEDAEPEELIITKVPLRLKKYTVEENDQPKEAAGTYSIKGGDLNIDGDAKNIIALCLISSLYATPEDKKKSEKVENIVNLQYQLKFKAGTTGVEKNNWITLDGPKVIVMHDLPFLDKTQSSGKVPSEIEIKYGSFRDIVVGAVAVKKKEQEVKTESSGQQQQSHEGEDEKTRGKKP